MTKEQANNYLRSSGFSDEQIETIARAYENPNYNSVKTELNELDCISRQALKDLGAECIAKRDENGNLIPLGSIDSLPSVSKEKTGRWEWVQYDSNPNIGNWHCSECNRIVRGAITAASPVYSYKYCPNCGARMVVDEPVDETIESVDECRFLCRWNKDYKCTKGHYERWCKDKILGEEGETE